MWQNICRNTISSSYNKLISYISSYTDCLKNSLNPPRDLNIPFFISMFIGNVFNGGDLDLTIVV